MTMVMLLMTMATTTMMMTTMTTTMRVVVVVVMMMLVEMSSSSPSSPCSLRRYCCTCFFGSFAFLLFYDDSCFQLHVLGFTLHTLLDQLSPTLSPGDLDHSLESIVEVSWSHAIGYGHSLL